MSKYKSTRDWEKNGKCTNISERNPLNCAPWW